MSSCGADVGIAADELEDVLQLLTPGHPRYVADEPGYYVIHPTVLATGRRRGPTR